MKSYKLFYNKLGIHQGGINEADIESKKLIPLHYNLDDRKIETDKLVILTEQEADLHIQNAIKYFRENRFHDYSKTWNNKYIIERFGVVDNISTGYFFQLPGIYSFSLKNSDKLTKNIKLHYKSYETEKIIPDLTCNHDTVRKYTDNFVEVNIHPIKTDKEANLHFKKLLKYIKENNLHDSLSEKNEYILTLEKKGVVIATKKFKLKVEREYKLKKKLYNLVIKIFPDIDLNCFYETILFKFNEEKTKIGFSFSFVDYYGSQRSKDKNLFTAIINFKNELDKVKEIESYTVERAFAEVKDIRSYTKTDLRELCGMDRIPISYSFGITCNLKQETEK